MSGAVQNKQAQEAKDAKNEGIDKEHAKVGPGGLMDVDDRPTLRPMPSRAKAGDGLVTCSADCCRRRMHRVWSTVRASLCARPAEEAEAS